ncbi:glycoside/pentoside/hexuronide:cation symporter, GPH family [Acetitomaculum ruminis DSM 5522]|uniref:Glycoside/pentoside/hexuronide:cation symporter, GPH family n=1 Tax=Acetitomaculum ruminis DSM 5522 TaxID=1120918 RepID=A0A1I0ZX78_9FIRM|nr:MFS transporter [Acetitomaculum ruminis]SFB29686.1 glycoside/pentoside/hexuronide:cation symporter, GPH family [Acetitomaculum ruminis DSM 5522]
MSDNQEPKKGISGALKIFYGVGDCGFNLMSSIESYFFTVFLTNLAQFSLPMVTFITTVASTIDACLSWIYGAVLNSIKPMKWGRYRSWLIVIPWLVPFLYAFQFIKVGDGMLSAIIIIIAAVSSHVAWNFAYVANVSMISVAGKTPEERSQLASTRGAWSNFSKVIFSYVGPGIAAICAGFIGEVNQYGACAFVLGCIFALLYFVHFKMFAGYEEVNVQDVVAAKAPAKDKTGGMDLIRALLQNPPLIALLIADLAKFMFNFVLMGFATYYFTYVANDAKMLTTYILVTNIFCVVGAYLSKTLSNKFSTRTTTIGVMFVQAVLLVVSYLFYNNALVVMVLMSLAMFGYGITYACTPALYGDTIVYAEWKTGKNAAGWISGLQNVPLKVSIMTRGIIISSCLAMGAFSKDIDPAQASDVLKNAISLGFMIIPAVALAVAVVALVFGFKLTKDKVNQYAAEIAARNN